MKLGELFRFGLLKIAIHIRGIFMLLWPNCDATNQLFSCFSNTGAPAWIKHAKGKRKKHRGGQPPAERESKPFFTSNLSSLFTTALVEKKLQGIFSLFFLCGKMEKLTLPCPPRSHVFFYFLCVFSSCPAPPISPSRCFHFIRTFTCLPDSFPAPLTTTRSGNRSHNPAPPTMWRRG